mgnify:FL=1
MDACIECGNDEPIVGYSVCSDCLERLGDKGDEFKVDLGWFICDDCQDMFCVACEDHFGDCPCWMCFRCETVNHQQLGECARCGLEQEVSDSEE